MSATPFLPARTTTESARAVRRRSHRTSPALRAAFGNRRTTEADTRRAAASLRAAPATLEARH
ncbi:hypothetical protein [Streptomyces sp. BRA346]|uniref:hypothetical protein n=1 Tax=Streptomyces sp. BRA346 TaxID=2878199 RepID=UPI004064A8C8